MKRFTIIIILLALLLAGCQSRANANKPESKRILDEATPAGTDDSLEISKLDTQTKDPVIIIQRSGGFAGVNEQWSYYLDGRIVKEYIDQTKPIETFSVEAAQVITQLEALKTAGFFDMRASSSKGMLNKCKDCFTYSLTATSDGKTNAITFQEVPGDTKDAVQKIVEQLIGLTNTTQ